MRAVYKVLLLILSLILFRMAFPGGPFPHLAWVALVPIALAARGSTPLKSTLWFGIWGSLVWFLCIWWVAGSVGGFLKTGVAFTFLVVFLLSVFSAASYFAFGWCFATFNYSERRFGGLLSAAAFTLLISWLPAIFPGNLSHAFYNSPTFIQVLDLGGVPLLLFLILLVNFEFVSILINLKTNKKSALTSSVVILFTLSCVMLYGNLRLRSLENQLNHSGPPALKAGIIQPNFRHKFLKKHRKTGLEQLIRSSEELSIANQDLDLIVWPEIPIQLTWTENAQYQQQISEYVRKSGRPLLFVSSFVYEKRFKLGDKFPYYNTAHLINESGALQNSHYKQTLLPLTEYMPLERQIPWLRKKFPRALRYIPGKVSSAFPLKNGISLIPLICYEVLFPELSARAAAAGGKVIINMTNDDWFGKTGASRIHMAVALFRSVEQRIPLIRVTNTGLSAAIDLTGKIQPGSETGLFEKTNRVYVVKIPETWSLYRLLGNWFLYLLTLAFGAELLIARLRKRILTQRHRDTGKEVLKFR